MDGIAIIFILLLILALCGVVVYFMYDYINYKAQTSTNITNVNNSLTQESQDRIGNLAYVVGEVNNVNDDIYTTMSSNINYTNSNVTVTQNTQNSLINSLNSAFSFTSSGTSGTTAGTTISLLNLPGYTTPNMTLLNHVNTSMGLTANQLTPANSTQFCGPPGSGLNGGTNCIKFPDSNGNTYLTPLSTSGKVVLDGSVVVNSNMTIGSAIGTLAAPTVGISSDGQNSLLFNANRVGLGITNPAYNFDVQGNSTSTGLLRLTPASSAAAAGSPAILVDATGNLIINQSIQLKSSATGNPTAITISPNAPAAGSAAATGITINPSTDGKSLTITAPGAVNVAGDFHVGGNFSVGSAASGTTPATTATGTINGKTITAV
uniref:Uncharacterized protein n=1 Tax=viral metagenome TaxID=1070528 RepID=A0A6C0KTN6_9ZZZZ